MSDDQKPEIPTDLKQDPEVRAEIKRNLLSALRLERYINIAKAIGFFLRTFKSEAVSLVSGIMTLFLGYKQIMKYAHRGNQEMKTESRWEKRDLKPIRSNMKALSSNAGAGRGSGNIADVPAGAEVTLSLSEEILISPMRDPGNWSLALFVIAFLISSAVAWFKKRRKGNEERRDLK